MYIQYTSHYTNTYTSIPITDENMFYLHYHLREKKLYWKKR